MGFDELERRIQELHGAKSPAVGNRRGVVIVGVIAVVLLAVLAIGIVGGVTSGSGSAPRASQAAVAPDAAVAPPLSPEMNAKVAAYREFLADVDGTLHGLRLTRPEKHETYLAWAWPIWLKPEELEARLDDLIALSRSEPAYPQLDGFAALYVESVRAHLPAWIAGVAAWKQGAAAFDPMSAPLRDSFERFGQHSQAFRAAMPPEPVAPVGSYEYVTQACFAGVDLMARADVPEPKDTVEVEAEVGRTSVYTSIAPGVIRAVGLRCARAALDLLEQADEPVASRAQVAVQMGLTLVSEESRRTYVHAYVTAFGNYVQSVAYAVRRR